MQMDRSSIAAFHALNADGSSPQAAVVPPGIFAQTAPRLGAAAFVPLWMGQERPKQHLSGATNARGADV